MRRTPEDQPVWEIRWGAIAIDGRLPVYLLHHLADFVLEEPTAALPGFAGLGTVRAPVDAKCEFLRNGTHVDDVSLLRDAAVCSLRRAIRYRPDSTDALRAPPMVDSSPSR